MEAIIQKRLLLLFPLADCFLPTALFAFGFWPLAFGRIFFISVLTHYSPLISHYSPLRAPFVLLTADCHLRFWPLAVSCLLGFLCFRFFASPLFRNFSPSQCSSSHRSVAPSLLSVPIAIGIRCTVSGF